MLKRIRGGYAGLLVSRLRLAVTIVGLPVLAAAVRAVPTLAAAAVLATPVFAVPGFVVAMLTVPATAAAAPHVLHTAGYESPVRGDPDDLLMIAGTGFEATDRVVYQAMSDASASAAAQLHPQDVPARSTSESGTAPIVQRGNPPYALTVRLPEEMQKGRAYRLWVVTAKGEWSESMAINDPRPQWVAPSYVYSTADVAGLGRVLRVVGRNLGGGSARGLAAGSSADVGSTEEGSAAGRSADAGAIGGASADARSAGGGSGTGSLEIRLRGADKRSYVLTSRVVPGEPEVVSEYAATASLPDHITPGVYSVAVRRKGLGWVEIPDQKLEVRADPPAKLRTFSLDDPAFGGCRPDDSADDSSCFARALEAARGAVSGGGGGGGGGGVSGGGGGGGGGRVIVSIPAGHWDLTTTTVNAGPLTQGFIIPDGVQLRGAGTRASFIVRHGPVNPHHPDALLTLSGHNSVVGLSFSDDVRFETQEQSRPVIQLGTTPPLADEFKAGHWPPVEDVIISDNRFLHVGRVITDEPGRPLIRLFITHNEFGAYYEAIHLPGNSAVVWEPFQISDSVIRGNRFIPGSYLDLHLHQGTIGSELGAAHHLDFSDNVADGGSSENLQNPDDPPGFRAAFFWNMSNSVELMLVSANHISCSGDKDGDGEALGFDGNSNTYGFVGTPSVTAAGRDWVTLSGTLIAEQAHRPVPANYYNGDWVQIVAGPGFGQTRKIVSYTQDPVTSTVTLHVAPAWDIPPGGRGSRASVQRQHWQVLVVGNNIEHRSPPCHKSNLTGPNGGEISIWTPSADFVVAGNRQYDTDGILFTQGYSAPFCPDCGNSLAFQTALEIRDNRIEGEYDWSSDCGDAGIRGTFGASPTPGSPPPVVGFGTSISHNFISHSDGPRGGGIDFAKTWYPGPPPGDWAFMENMLIFHNQVEDMEGPPPTPKCHIGQRERSGIRLEGQDNIRDTVLYENRCERVSTPLYDTGLRTLKICPAGSRGNCECADSPP